MGIWGAFFAPLFYAYNGRFLEVGLQLGLQSGVTFLKKWGYKSGVKHMQVAWGGKLPL